MSKCTSCGGDRIVKVDDELKPCPSLSVTALGRLACKLPDGSFDARKEHRDIANAKMQKDKAYHERNLVVAALAKHVIAMGGVAGLKHTKIPGWNPEWYGCVYIVPPGGKQLSWHYHDSHAYVFAGLPLYEGEWDGHDTPEKYRRLKEWSDLLLPSARRLEKVAAIKQMCIDKTGCLCHRCNPERLSERPSR